MDALAHYRLPSALGSYGDSAQDLTPDEAAAVAAHRALIAWCIKAAAEVRALPVAGDSLSVTWITVPEEIAQDLVDRARYLAVEISDIECGRAREE